MFADAIPGQGINVGLLGGGGGGGSAEFNGVTKVGDSASTSYPQAADTDTARGTALRTACAAAVAGDTVIVGPGGYNLGSNTITLADNVNLNLAAGARIYGTADLLSDGPMITPGNNSILYGLGTIEGTAVSAYQAPIGLDEDSNGIYAVGVQVIGLTLIGDSDGFYINNANNACEAILRDCTLITKFDAAVCSSGVGASPVHRLDLYDCRIVITGPSSAGLGISRGVMAQRGSILRVFGGSIKVIDAGATLDAAAAALDGGTVELHGVACEVSNGGNPKYDLYNDGSSTVKVAGGSGSGTGNSFLTSGTITRMNGDISLTSSGGNAVLTIGSVSVTFPVGS